MSKPQIEVRSVRMASVVVRTLVVSDVSTMDSTSRTLRVVVNGARPFTVRDHSVDIRSINRALHEPLEPMPEVTAARADASTR